LGYIFVGDSMMPTSTTLTLSAAKSIEFGKIKITAITWF